MLSTHEKPSAISIASASIAIGAIPALAEVDPISGS
tara:strand:+ start:231 stop:338 length:108 start_codon:yes stop_codon:yes gene_type:complete